MFDIEKILLDVYKANDNKDPDTAVDILTEFFWDAVAYQDFDSMNLFYEKIDLSKISLGSTICCPVMHTFKYIPQIPNHLPYCHKAMERYMELGYDEDRIHRIMDDYLQVGDYWEYMDKLGAPEWLSGKKPD